jgi:hypothetical protein
LVSENDAISEIERAKGCSADEERQICDRLIGANRLWMRACQQAVQQQRFDWLERYASAAHERPWPLDLLEDSDPGHIPIAQMLAGCAYTALLCQNVSTIAQTTESSPLVTSLYKTAARWQQTDRGIEVNASSGDGIIDQLHQILLHTNDPPLQRLFVELHRIVPSWRLAEIRDLTISFLSTAPLVYLHHVKIPVLLDLRNGDGLVAILSLESYANGFGQFYADPRNMAFFRCDDAFQRALDVAWGYARSRGRLDD